MPEVLGRFTVGGAAAHLIPGEVGVEAGSFGLPHAVVVRIAEVRPEALVLVAVPGEVQHAKASQRSRVNEVATRRFL